MNKLIAGNWKMNETRESAATLIKAIASGILRAPDFYKNADFLVCPPFLHLCAVGALCGDHVALGGQDCAHLPNGAHTGDISAAMLTDCGCRYVILGHSERRQNHGESSARVAEKAAQAHDHGLITIICVGETEDEREAQKQEDIVRRQLDESLPATAQAANTVIAYEPVWAIGTGKTATPADVKAMHSFIHHKLEEKLADGDKIRILYGGSVKPENAAELFAVPHVDGALIGGASLKAESFLGIAKEA